MDREKIRGCAQELGELLLRISRNIPSESAPGAALEEFDVSPSELFVLEFLKSRSSEPSMSEIHDALGMELSTVTRVVGKLVRKKMARRRPDTADRRVVRVDATDGGREVLGIFGRERTRRIVGILEQMDDDEIEQLITIMRRIEQRIGSET